MKKLISATAVCALAVGIVAAPSALGVKAPKQVGGTVSVNVTPTTVTPGDEFTTVTASGNVASNSSCRKDRTVHFAYVENGVVGPELGTAITGSNGDYTATLAEPTSSDLTTSHSVVLRATVDQVTRKVGSKKKGKKTKKGRRFDCLQLAADSSPITVTPGF
jgi:hypothetical protein